MLRLTGVGSSGYYTSGDLVFSDPALKEEVLGVTISKGFAFKGTRSDLYLFKNAFTSKERLYYVMGHEFIHVQMNFAGIASTFQQEAAAYKWMEIQWYQKNLASSSFPWPSLLNKYSQHYNPVFQIFFPY